jgi:mono/diheme cytochrome c family protein
MLTCVLRSVQVAPVVLALWGFAAREAAADQPVSFARQIKPILAGKCFACHGPDEMQRQGELRLDVRDEAVPSVIKPGDGEHSEVYVRVTAADADSRMPPPDAKKPAVTAAEAALIRRWIDEGARYDVHWAYVPPAGASVPPVRTADWPRNPIDHFILARLEAAGLAPAAEADRRVLLRRAALDLTGLAPSAEEVEHFLANISPSPPLPLSRS